MRGLALRAAHTLEPVREGLAALAQDPDVSRWNGQSLSSGQLAPGTPADVGGYR